MNQLEILRESLGQCDEIILDALLMRNRIVEDIMAYKEANDLPILQPEQEARQKEWLEKRMEEKRHKAEVEDVFGSITMNSKRIQSRKLFNYNIVLIGFMGSGKSTISEFLKNSFAMEVIEMDQIIAEREGMTISDIFEVYGEQYFRNLETNLLIEMQSKTNVVISCGGGTPMRECNVVEMKKNGRVVLLTAKPETILDRVKEFIYQNGGVVKKSQLNELGIDYRRILDFVEKGDLIRIKNGYYAVRLSDFSEEELIARLFPDCVLNLETALYAYGYLNRKPYGYKLSVDKNTSKSRFKLDFPPVVPLYAEPETLTLGVTEIDYGGAKMKIFDRERLMCECLKYEDKMERELFKEGLLAYIRDPKKDVAKLMKYARERRVVKKVQTMIGVWL